MGALKSGLAQRVSRLLKRAAYKNLLKIAKERRQLSHRFEKEQIIVLARFAHQARRNAMLLEKARIAKELLAKTRKHRRTVHFKHRRMLAQGILEWRAKLKKQKHAVEEAEEKLKEEMHKQYMRKRRLRKKDAEEVVKYRKRESRKRCDFGP